MAKPGEPRAVRTALLGLATLAAVVGALAVASAILEAYQVHRITAPLRQAGPEELRTSLRYDLKGGDLAEGDYVSVTDEAECCSVCNDNSECYAWVYASFNDACNGPCCFLKDSSWTEWVEGPSLVAGVYSG
ncbi:hypothetical protein ABPG77_009184 [Micractinium sp. CCAP 211/92]